MLDISTQIEIVEVMANPAGKDSGEEYVIIKNQSEEEISLSNFYLDDKENESSPYKMENLSIPPLGEIILQSSATNISLNNTNDEIRILNPDLTVLTTIELSRSYEGMAWRNETGTPPTITEIFPNPEGSDGSFEWIEITNTETNAINLTGYYLDDGEEGSNPYALSGILYPSEYRIITDSESGITLNNTQDEVRIISQDEELIKIEYESAKEDKSFSLTENGWQWTLPTKGSTNTKQEDQEETKKTENTQAIIEIENSTQEKKLTDILPYLASALIIGTLTAYEKIAKK